mmetsp:Transcript_98595/g.205561  ORF Transcript_98595/g.205561 Transcript_98595/m.205561 type:complete len:249 (+) Transcript_98595:216-962(+)
MARLSKVLCVCLLAVAVTAEKSAEEKINALNNAVADLSDKLQHEGSTRYWQRFNTAEMQHQSQALQAAAASPEAKLRQMKKQLTTIAKKMSTDDDSSSRGSASYWQSRSRAAAEASAAEVKPLSAVAQVRSCIGDAGTAVAEAIEEFSARKANQTALDRKIELAQEKVHCAMDHLSADDVHGGSADYWSMKARKFDQAVMHDRWTVVAASLFVCLILGGSVAGIVLLKDANFKDQEVFEGGSEPLIAA